MVEGEKYGEEPRPTMENMAEQTAALKQKTAEARRRQLEDANKQADQDVELRQQQQDLESALTEAQQALAFYENQEKAGSLDSDGSNKLAELKETVASIQEQLDEVNRRAEQIAQQPEVMDEIRQRAIDQDNNIEQEKAREAKQKETNQHKLETAREQFTSLQKEVNENLEIISALINSDQFKEEIESKIKQIEKLEKARFGKEKKAREARSIRAELKKIRQDIDSKLIQTANKTRDFGFRQKHAENSEDISLDAIFTHFYQSRVESDEIKQEKNDLQQQIEQFRDDTIAATNDLDKALAELLGEYY